MQFAEFLVAGKEFVICIDNEDYPASLERRKIYEVIPDIEAVRHNMIRVINESGEDYLYDDSRFIRYRFSEEVVQALTSAS